MGALGVALALLTAAIVLWVSKSKKRKLERLERRNSIRQSLHSLRSVGSTSGFTELAYRRKPIAVSEIIINLLSIEQHFPHIILYFIDETINRHIKLQIVRLQKDA